MRDLHDLLPPAAVLSSANAINDAGVIVGDFLAADFLHHYGFLLKALLPPDGAIIVGTKGSESTLARGTNNSGQVVGMSGSDAVLVGRDHIFQHLGTLGGVTSCASAVNNEGQVVGVSDTERAGEHAFLWKAGGGMYDLGAIGGQANQARGINNAGQVVGGPGFDRNGKRSSHPAFLYTNGKMTDLNILIDRTSGWHLMEAAAINDLGQIVGQGRNSAGQFHAFLLTPVP